MLYNPSSPHNTLSPSCLKIYSGFKKVTSEALSHVIFHDPFKTTTKVKTTIVNRMDYLNLPVMTILPTALLAIHQISLRQQNAMSPEDLLRDIHIRLGHVSIDTIITMSKKGIISNLPHITKTTPIQCHICNRCNIRRIPRGPSETTLPPPFARLHIDFMFYSVTSIRNNTAALSVVDAGTSYPWIFPTTSKRAPLDIVRFLINVLRNQGKKFFSIRTDEDGALARNTEFCNMLMNELHLIIEPTHGYNSTANGKVERSHQTYHRMVRASLYTMQALLPPNYLPPDLPLERFWCLAITYAAHIKRRLISARHNDSPYYLIYKKRPNYKDLHVFGAISTIIKDEQNKLLPRGTTGLFMGYGNTTKSPLYFCLTNRTLQRSHHLIVNDASHRERLPNIFTSPTNNLPTVQLNSIKLDLLPTPFATHPIHTYEITIPHHATHAGLEILDDEYFNIPYLSKTVRDTPAFETIPAIHRRNMFIVSVNQQEPITAARAIELIKPPRLRSQNTIVIKLQITKRISSAKSKLQELRSTFDQIRPIISSLTQPIPSIGISSSLDAAQLVLPDKPKPERFIFQNLRTSFRQQWKAALFNQYSKNDDIHTFSPPILRSSLPKNTKVYPSRIAPTIKSDPTIPNLYTFHCRHAVDGSGMRQGIDYKYSFSPTASTDSIRIVIAVSSSIMNTLYVLDIKNAFQTTLVEAAERIFLSCPPLYLDWYFHRYRKSFKGENKEYVLQALRNIQGKKDAGRAWYFLFIAVLRDYGFLPTAVDHCIFVKKIDTSHAYIALSTDDNLCSFSSYNQFVHFHNYIKKYFECTVKTGAVIYYLNMRITQSELGISIDQTDSILSFLTSYFGKQDKIKTSTIPYSTDSTFEKNLASSIPATPEELTALETSYKGSYRSLIGTLLHFSNNTRHDIMYAISRLSCYNAAPNPVAFQGIKKIIRYLAFKPHVPIFYPRHSLSAANTIMFHFSPHQKDKMTYPNHLAVHADAGMPHDLRDYKATMCTIFTLLGVSVAPQSKKTTNVPSHSTDAELRASHHAIKKAYAFRSLLTSMGVSFPEPITLYQDNDAAKAIMSAGKMPTRTKHMAIITTFNQEHHNNETVRTVTEPTSMMLADFGTKPATAPVLTRLHYWSSGVRFYPPPTHPHFKHLRLHWFEQKFLTITPEK